MTRKLTPRSSLETFKREAKRWLAALRENDPAARARLVRAHPTAPPNPGLRDVQLALAREYGFPGWMALRSELASRHDSARPAGHVTPLQELLLAAAQGDAGRVREALKAHPGIVSERGELPGHTGKRSALHFAMNSLNETVVEVLLEHGADPNARDEGDNAMPLHFAAEREHLGIVRRLIESGADPIGTGDGHELEVIGWATCFARSPNGDVVSYLLAHGARHNIFSAVATGAVAAIQEIVAHAPAQRDRSMDRTNQHRRPLHLAVVKHQPESLDTLLALGAEVDARDAAGLTPLDQAALAGERAMAERLIARGARVDLPAAVALGRDDDMQRLLRDEPESLRPGGRWDRVIVRASERAPAHVIEALVKAGASVHVRDDHRTAVDGTHGYTALHAAAFHGNTDAVRALLRLGANPADREDKYWGTPAGWANHAGHGDTRDLILDGVIDIFDAIEFDRVQRIAGILTRDPQALDRKFGAYVTGDQKPREWLDPAWTPLAYAVAHGRAEAARELVALGADLTVRDSSHRDLASLGAVAGHDDIVGVLRSVQDAPAPRGRIPDAASERVARFLRSACLDWRTGGSQRAFARNDAGRMLQHHPELATSNIYTVVACGALDAARRMLDAEPELATAPGGPRSWPPLLYLCSARLPQPHSSENAVAIARLLLEHGADPNTFYLGGNADIHYTALTCVLGRGEELASMHAHARALTRLLLERGADPHDNQVLYNVFADNTSRHLLDNDIIWLLELMYQHSVLRGHLSDWADPAWPMFAMRGAPSLGDENRFLPGARFMLDAAVDCNLLPLAEWMLAHGAGPNTPSGPLWRRSPRSLYQEALARGHSAMAELLVRYGATATAPVFDAHEAFVRACLALDRQSVRTMIRRQPEVLNDPRALSMAARQDRADVVDMLIDLGFSPDVAHPNTGARALHAAAAAGAARSAERLIARGAAVDAHDSLYDSPPLGWASYFGQSATIELLGRYSSDVWRLTFTGQVDRLRALLDADPTLAQTSNGAGDTPLMWLPDDAASALTIARLFLDHGAPASLRNARGLTAADIAASRGLEDVAALLREAGG